MIVYIMQKVAGFKYYWNGADGRWEGLINNATPMKLSEAKEIQISFAEITELVTS